MANVFKDRYEELCDKVHSFEMEGNQIPLVVKTAMEASEAFYNEGKHALAFGSLKARVKSRLPHISA